MTLSRKVEELAGFVKHTLGVDALPSFKAKRHTYWRRVILTYKEDDLPLSFWRKLRECRSEASMGMTMSNGVFFRSVNTMLVPDRWDPGFESTVLHELCHLYTHNRNPHLSDFYDDLNEQARLLQEGKEYDESFFDRFFTTRCIDEGIACYVGIEADKLRVRTADEKPLITHCWRKEARLADPLNYDPKNVSEEGTQLDPAAWNEFAGWQKQYLSRVKDPLVYDQVAYNEKSFSNFLNRLSDEQMHIPVIGYHVIRTLCGEASEGLAEKINPVIDNPPQRFEDLMKMFQMKLIELYGQDLYLQLS
ncbi:hypothetical protein KY363_06645 [Candidatus Woesearchaeota archaeon]|nr:hypothetical protein [Candidatus Woesearchaeota archaeon]